MADLVNVAPGQCRLTVDSTSQISLQRFKGMFIPLKISGTWEAKIIPSTAPTLANTGLTAGTSYNVYAFDSGGTLTLEAVTTAHAVDADTGVEIKSGDASRTLVGKVHMDAGTPGTFVDSTTKRWCLNWFNRRLLDAQGTVSANRNMTGFSFVEPSSEIRAAFLTWADEAVYASIGGTIRNNAASDVEYLMGVAFDGTTPEVCGGGKLEATGDGGDHDPLSAAVWKTLTEGSHYATMVGAFSDTAAGLTTVFTADTASSGRGKAWVRVGIQG